MEPFPQVWAIGNLSQSTGDLVRQGDSWAQVQSTGTDCLGAGLEAASQHGKVTAAGDFYAIQHSSFLPGQSGLVIQTGFRGV